MTDLNSMERSLLAALAEADEPSEADRERVKALVLQRVATATGIAAATWGASSAATKLVSGGAAAAGAGAAGTGTGTAAVLAAWKGAAAAKVTAAVLGIGVASGAGWYAVSGNSAGPGGAEQGGTPAAVVSQPLESKQRLHSDKAPAEVVAEVATENVPSDSTHLPRAVRDESRGAAAAKMDHLAEEAELLKRAQQAVNSGNSPAALSMLQEHASKYPSGVLIQERIGLRAIALCRSGNRDQGVTEAQRFLKANPASPLSDRVRGACELTSR